MKKTCYYLTCFIVLTTQALNTKCFARSRSAVNADNDDAPVFMSLPLVLATQGVSFRRGIVYELTDDWDRRPIAGYGKGNDVAITLGRGRKVLIRPYSRQYAEGDFVEGNYFKFIGVEEYEESKIAQTIRLPLLAECSPTEAARYDDYKQRLLDELQAKEHEQERWAAVMKALEGIDNVVDDEKIRKSAYEKTAAVYDDAYTKFTSHEKAAAFANEYGRRIFQGFADEKEKRQREWDAAHPEEVAARRKAEAARLAKLAKEKMEAEIEQTRQKLSMYETYLKKYAEINPKNPIPESLNQLNRRLGARVVPPYDAWNNRLILTNMEYSVKVFSVGADGQAGTSDDLSILVAHTGSKEIRKTNQRDLYAELTTYKSSFINSVFGFAFGSKTGSTGRPVAGVVTSPLKKSFRGITNAELVYEGEYSPRLVAVRLIGTTGNDLGTKECQKIISLLEKNYNIKFSKSIIMGCVRAEYSNDDFVITVRNDTYTADGENAYVLEFKDNKLIKLIQELDQLVDAGKTESDADKVELINPTSQEKQAEERSDDDGLDALNL